MSLMSLGIDAVERGVIPDVVTRAAIGRLCKQRLRDSNGGNDNADGDSQISQAFVDSMRMGPIEPAPEKANERHYELPPVFFAAFLGPHRKHSACYFSSADISLVAAEA